MMVTTRIALVATALTVAAAPTAVRPADCRALSQVMKEQSERGVVTSIDGDIAQQIASLLWHEAGKIPPEVDRLVITFMYDGSVSLIPASSDKVCVSGIPVKQDALTRTLVKVGAKIE